jgi:di/tricarboxylate transporter
MVIAGVPFGALLVFVRIGVALVSFVTEAVPNDVTAGIIVALAALEPAIGFTPRDGWAPTPFSFLLAVLFAAATSFITPVGYQTNQMYGSGSTSSLIS